MSWAGPNGFNPSQQGPPRGPFDFIQSFDPHSAGPLGHGVDHVGIPPFAGPPPWFHDEGPGRWGGRGRFGRRGGRPGLRRGCRRDDANGSPEEVTSDCEIVEKEKDGDKEKEKDESPETMRESPDGPPEYEHEPGHDHDHHHEHRHGSPGRRGRGCGRRMPHGGDRWRHCPPHPGMGPHPVPPAGPPPYFAAFANNGQGPPNFDLPGFLRSFSAHPLAQSIREWAENWRNQQHPRRADDNDVFRPPIDVFNTEKAFVLHVALPGAKKEDIGVNWDADKHELNIAGVVYRPGEEEFLQHLSSSERRVGMFERNVTLPPPGVDPKEEIDGLGITARMEDGILIVVVPKLEKEWTEIHKVDIE